jgi:hypothetical protein
MLHSEERSLLPRKANPDHVYRPIASTRLIKPTSSRAGVLHHSPPSTMPFSCRLFLKFWRGFTRLTATSLPSVPLFCSDQVGRKYEQIECPFQWRHPTSSLPPSQMGTGSKRGTNHALGPTGRRLIQNTISAYRSSLFCLFPLHAMDQYNRRCIACEARENHT